jgi:hypothetical protein
MDFSAAEEVKGTPRAQAVKMQPRAAVAAPEHAAAGLSVDVEALLANLPLDGD